MLIVTMNAICRIFHELFNEAGIAGMADLTNKVEL